jgi:regulator of protease activity HflC (stomatin/prohibitin superfamily)
MDDDARKEELRNLLLTELEIQSARGRFDPGQRLGWLAEHLEEYVDRWLGFVALPSWPMSHLLRFDGFVMVEIGTEVLDAEIKRAAPPPNVLLAWNEFVARLDAIRDGGDKMLAERLGEAVREVRTAISDANASWKPRDPPDAQ